MPCPPRNSSGRVTAHMNRAARALPTLLVGLLHVGSLHVGFVLVGLVLVACEAAPEAPRRPHLLLVTLDTTRADHTSLFDPARATTPALRALAAEGASFAAAYAPSPSTGPTHASLFTGLHPIGHGLLKNTLSLPDALPSLPAVLADAGYETGAVVSSFVLHSRFGFARGFASYRDDFPAEQATLELEHWEGLELDDGFDRRADHTSDLALGWLRERDPARPFFLFVHYFDPHLPYTPPPDFAARFDSGAEPGSTREAVDRYDAELAFTDRELGRLLDGLEALGVAEETLVVVAGDHGEGLMDHGHMEHGIHLFEEAVRVPWVWRWPGEIDTGRAIEGPVQLVDLAPTLLAMLGVEVAASFHGVDLSPALLEGAPLDAERPLFLQTDRPASLRQLRNLRGAQWAVGEMFGVRAGPWKLLEDRRRGERALYHLEHDPQERRDLLAAEPERAAELAETLASWKREHLRAAPAAPELTEREIEAFRALGYVE